MNARLPRRIFDDFVTKALLMAFELAVLQTTCLNMKRTSIAGGAVETVASPIISADFPVNKLFCRPLECVIWGRSSPLLSGIDKRASAARNERPR